MAWGVWVEMSRQLALAWPHGACERRGRHWGSDTTCALSEVTGQPEAEPCLATWCYIPFLPLSLASLQRLAHCLVSRCMEAALVRSGERRAKACGPLSSPAPALVSPHSPE